MSFTQCKDTAEVEKALGKRTHGFVIEDHRIYDEIELWDNACMYKFDSETAMRLYDLQSDIEMMGDGGFEQSFLDLEDNARKLGDIYRKVAALIKAKPIKKDIR